MLMLDRLEPCVSLHWFGRTVQILETRAVILNMRSLFQTSCSKCSRCSSSSSDFAEILRHAVLLSRMLCHLPGFLRLYLILFLILHQPHLKRLFLAGLLVFAVGRWNLVLAVFVA